MIEFEKLREKNIEETKNKLRESVSKETILIQTKEAIDELKKTANVLASRLREWYAYYNPEFEKSLKDNEKFAELCAEEKPSKNSLGGKFEKEDIERINTLAAQLNKQHNLIKELEKYLEELIKKICPNMNELTGAQIGSELIILARSLKKLSEMPASTIQLLGAEEALFRHLKTKSKSPKYGILFMHSLVQKAKERGKAARILADKIAIAVKIDKFNGKFIGDKLRKEVEDKIAKLGIRDLGVRHKELGVGVAK